MKMGTFLYLSFGEHEDASLWGTYIGLSESVHIVHFSTQILPEFPEYVYRVILSPAVSEGLDIPQP
jgi:hypothetical protein